jgi:hypothetical protein
MAYPSTSNLDPNRMYYGQVGKRKPWFIGYTNKQTPTPGKFVSSVPRYGVRGADGLRTWSSNRESFNPEFTVNESTPDFLSHASFVNEWTPTVRAHPVAAGRSSLTAPRLWPKESEFTTGFVDRRPTTTSRWETKPRKVKRKPIQISHKLERYAELSRAERDHLAQRSTMSSLTRSMTSGSKLEGSLEGGASLVTSGLSLVTFGGQETRASTANSSLKNVKGRGDPRYGRTEKYGKDVVGMRYSGPSMVISKTQVPNENAGTENAAELRHQLRKQMIWQLYGLIYQDQAAHSPKQVAHDLAEIFRKKKDSRVADPVLVKRDVFIEVMISEIKDYTEMMAFRLFSLFDVYNHGKIEYSVPLAMLLAICDHGLTVEQRIADLWNFFKEYLQGRSEVNIFQHIFMSCCYSVEQERAMREMLKTEFRPMFYEYQSYFGLYDDGSGAGGGGGDTAATAALLVKGNKGKKAKAPGTPKEGFNHEDLLNLCKQCTGTLSLFDREMSELLTSLHHDTKQEAHVERANLRNNLRTQRATMFKAQPKIRRITSVKPGIKIDLNPKTSLI